MSDAKRHRHWFSALWTTFGPYGRQDVHYHSCIEGDCARVIVGIGRTCDGKDESHHRETLRAGDE